MFLSRNVGCSFNSSFLNQDYAPTIQLYGTNQEHARAALTANSILAWLHNNELNLRFQKLCEEQLGKEPWTFKLDAKCNCKPTLCSPPSREASKTYSVSTLHQWYPQLNIHQRMVDIYRGFPPAVIKTWL